MTRTATFTVTLTAPQTVPIYVDWTTVDGTAVSPDDYTPDSGTLTFNPGEASKPINIHVSDAYIGDAANQFSIEITSSTMPTNGVILDDTGACNIPDPPVITPTEGPLIHTGLITNSYHTEYGRGGYFYPTSGTSEGQGVFINACYLIYEALNGGTPNEQAAADYYKSLAETMLDALGDGSPDGPSLRQPIPDDPETLTLIHWLFAARGPVPLQDIILDYGATRVGSKLTVTDTNIFKVWQIYPATSKLLYNSPYSPAFDIAAPAGETQILITDTDWTQHESYIEITIPAGAPADAAWKIVYGVNNAGVIARGDAYEAYPSWTAIPDGYSACAPDTFRWFDQTLTKAIAHDARPGNATKWTKLRAALRRTCVKGQNLTDLREVFKPYKGFDAIPGTGEPSGMFCYSDHPSATAPPVGEGLDPGWIGYNFWDRYGDGDLRGQVPSSTIKQVQIGRGFNDEWRVSQTYQDPDIYIFISCACTKKPTTGEHFYVFVSSDKVYNPAKRWQADIGPYSAFVAKSQTALDDGTGIVEFLIPRTDFHRIDDSSVLPAGTRFENYGVSIEIAGPYNVRIRKLRPVSGVDAAWVTANYAQAIEGTQLPFFPGSLPFVINADTIKQMVVGYNGSPFHGYQLPDLWMFLAADATAVHGTLTANDLPIPNPTTGAIEHPMVMTDALGATKPAHALLMEQQIRFLKAAQDRYVLDGGTLGPFAHTFVVNTSARLNLGFPTPHTWVYTNDDPNTRWIGYQCRVVESLASAAFLSKTQTGFNDVYTMSRALAVNWLTWLNTAWPNLSGTPYHGMPTDYPDPRISAPQTLYEEPHGPMLVARAALWLKKADPTMGSVADALMLRCWQYIETIFVLPYGEMQLTWSPVPTARSWYGFWHGEIITTMALFIQNAASIPTSIDLTLVRKRLVQTHNWLRVIGVHVG